MAAHMKISAHLDRGWDLCEKGDFGGAEKSARMILRLDKGAPEGYLLLGAIANGRGDPEAALAQFERAMEIDPSYLEPILHAAETCLCALDDAERACELAQLALEHTGDDPNLFADALLIKADAELSAGQDEAARATLSELPEDGLEDPGVHLRAGRLWLDLGAPARAERALRRVLDASSDDGDAWHALGMVAEARGVQREMVKCWRKVRELDLRDRRVPWALGEAAFEKIAEQALFELPERIRALLSNVPILVSDYPSLEIVAEGNDPRMMGFFSGVPYPEKSTLGGAAAHLDCIFLYQRNIERASRTKAEMLEEIRTTLLHETGHFFGLSERELEAIGLG